MAMALLEKRDVTILDTAVIQFLIPGKVRPDILSCVLSNCGCWICRCRHTHCCQAYQGPDLAELVISVADPQHATSAKLSISGGRNAPHHPKSVRVGDQVSAHTGFAPVGMSTKWRPSGRRR
eukprot:CAMPEP_0197436208 /NCGR_PEP_ID=MMETSP1175-20131217/3684_1 /TAXON_ID=1003142 /ORGANISM="Triceratium dubium, Strain CCMP147" /LENGTH=121 /DNA_ID=CAMNT_0042965443 /DNA_START=434 /DNA_END=795 /DNA_ORIENTATION=-